MFHDVHNALWIHLQVTVIQTAANARDVTSSCFVKILLKFLSFSVFYFNRHLQTQ